MFKLEFNYPENSAFKGSEDRYLDFAPRKINDILLNDLQLTSMPPSFVIQLGDSGCKRCPNSLESVSRVYTMWNLFVQSRSAVRMRPSALKKNHTGNLSFLYHNLYL